MPVGAVKVGAVGDVKLPVVDAVSEVGESLVDVGETVGAVAATVTSSASDAVRDAAKSVAAAAQLASSRVSDVTSNVVVALTGARRDAVAFAVPPSPPLRVSCARQTRRGERHVADRAAGDASLGARCAAGGRDRRRKAGRENNEQGLDCRAARRRRARRLDRRRRRPER